MILLTKQNGTIFAINPDLFETMEETPDTTIRTTTKNHYIVSETMEDVIKKITAYRRECSIVLRK